VLLLVIVVLLVGLLVLDRLGVTYAEDRVAAQLQEDLALSVAPQVDIRGFPVLTQAVAGRYGDVRVTVDAADLGELSNLDIDVRLRGLRIPLSRLVAEDIERVPVDSINGTVSIPYAEVAEQIGSGVMVEETPDGVTVSQTLDVLGQPVAVSGIGQIEVLSPAEIGVTVLRLNLAGLEVPDFFVEQLQEQLSFVYTVPPLPFGLQIQDVQATAAGFDVSAAAQDAVLEPV